MYRQTSLYCISLYWVDFIDWKSVAALHWEAHCCCFPAVFAHILSLCHILVILTIFQTLFTLLLNLLWWSVVGDLFNMIVLFFNWSMGFPGGSVVKNPPVMQETWKFRFNPWVRKILWRRSWQPPPVFLPGEPHGQRSLVGYSPWGRKDSDTTEVT